MWEKRSADLKVFYPQTAAVKTILRNWDGKLPAQVLPETLLLKSYGDRFLDQLTALSTQTQSPEACTEMIQAWSRWWRSGAAERNGMS